MVHSLYTQKEIFLRELISNASDALDKIHHRSLTDRNIRDPDAELDIEIEVSSSNKTLTIRDRGIGMTRDEVNENIGTIARSGSAEFAAKLADAGDEQEKLKLIGPIRGGLLLGLHGSRPSGAHHALGRPRSRRGAVGIHW